MTKLYENGKFNRAAIMTLAHSKVRTQLEQWPALYQGQTYAQILALCLKEAWSDANNRKINASSGLSEADQKKLDSLRNRITVLRCGETSRINHSADIANLYQQINDIREAA